MKLRRPLSAFSVHPGYVALLWFAVAVVDVAIVVVSDDDTIGPVSSNLHLSGAPLLAALVAGAILGLRTIALRLMTALLAFALIGGLVMLTAELLVSPDSAYGGTGVLTLMGIWYLLLVVLIWRSFAALASRKRRMAAILAVTLIYALAGSFKSFDDSFYRLSYAYSQWAHPEPEEAEEEAQFSFGSASRRVGLRRVDIGNADALTIEPKGITIHHAIDPAADVAKSN